MSRTGIAGTALMCLIVADTMWAQAVVSGSIEDRIRRLAEDLGPARICMVNADGDVDERRSINALVWSSGGPWRALVFNTRVSSAGSASSSCWSSPGACATITGVLSSFDAFCDPARPALVSTGSINVVRPDRALLGADVLEGAAPLLEAARQLRSGETEVGFVDSAMLFFEPPVDGAKRVRIVHAAGELTIERLRAPLDVSLIDVAVGFAARAQSNELQLIGPNGALSANNLLVIDTVTGTSCHQVVDHFDFYENLNEANEKLLMDSVPITEVEKLALYDDVIHAQIGGPLDARFEPLAQDPWLFLDTGAAPMPCS